MSNLTSIFLSVVNLAPEWRESKDCSPVLSTQPEHILCCHDILIFLGRDCCLVTRIQLEVIEPILHLKKLITIYIVEYIVLLVIERILFDFCKFEHYRRCILYSGLSRSLLVTVLYLRVIATARLATPRSQILPVSTQ